MTPNIDHVPEQALIKSEVKEFLKENELNNNVQGIQKITPEFSERQYYRIFLKDRSFVLQHSFGEAPEAIFDSFLKTQAAFRSARVKVPKIYAHSKERSWILMEDLGKIFLQSDPRVSHIESSLEYLIHLMQSYDKKRDAQKLSKQCPNFSLSFDEAKYEAEMKYCHKYFITQTLRKDGNSFLEWCRPNNAFLAQRAFFFCHRDYHSRNILLKNGHPVVIDFQDARWGPITYDLVSFLWDPYLKLEKSQIEVYLKSFLAVMLEYKNEFSKEQCAYFENIGDFKEELCRMRVQRMLKVVGSFAAIHVEKNNKNFLEYIRPALNSAVEALHDLERLKKLQDEDFKLREFLEQIDYEA